MEYVITGAIAALLMPPGNLPVLIAFALFAARRSPRLFRGILVAGLAAMYALSIPAVSSRLLASLEPRPADPGADRSGEAIVVLGGGAYIGAPEYGGDTVNTHTLVRLRYGAHLRRVLGKPVLVSGGTHRGGATSEALAMRRVLTREFGVPVRWIEDASSNTLANARGSARLLEEAGIRRVYLVTHAFHMPRARYAFESVGLEVIPAPTAFTTRPTVAALDFLPTGQALFNASWFFHEVMGIGWYHLRVALGR
ncbi:MAG: YdcF family protein [Burkholderiales bacterium]|nr:YdcF family protein [Burkholderiales bacterium]